MPTTATKKMSRAKIESILYAFGYRLWNIHDRLQTDTWFIEKPKANGNVSRSFIKIDKDRTISFAKKNKTWEIASNVFEAIYFN